LHRPPAGRHCPLLRRPVPLAPTSRVSHTTCASSGRLARSTYICTPHTELAEDALRSQRVRTLRVTDRDVFREGRSMRLGEMRQRSVLRRAALRYADHGWRVVPGAFLADNRYVCGPLCPTVACH